MAFYRIIKLAEELFDAARAGDADVEKDFADGSRLVARPTEYRFRYTNPKGELIVTKVNVTENPDAG